MFRAVVVAVLFLSCARADEQKASSPAHFVIHWHTNAIARGGQSVEVRGKVQETVEIFSAEKALIVEVEQDDIRSAMGLPPVVGKYQVTKDSLEFRPQFPFQAGVRYRATFYPNGEKPISSVLEMPRRQREPSTVVTQIFPSADVLPENLLKFYLSFSAPMGGGHIYDHIHLRDEAGRTVELPFLEIDEELWDPEMRRLTLFLDPGRIKRGVKPLEEVGPALQEGKEYTLTIDAAWLDATGTPLKRSFEKKFRVATADREAPNLAEWELILPKAGTIEPLTINFSDPMDHALALRMIGVDKVQGMARLDDHERKWIFVPDGKWEAGRHRLLVQTTIEDLAGNNVGKPFEVDLFSGVQKRITREVAERTFEIR